MSDIRVRLVGATIALDVVTDDGDTLAPVTMNPIRLSPAELESFDIDAVLAKVAHELGLSRQESDA